MRFRRCTFPIALAGLAVAVCGWSCSGRPPPPKTPEVNAGAAAGAAVAKYDGNGDGKIDATEAKKIPPLEVAFSRIDTNKDGFLDADEIATRIKGWLRSGTTITNGSSHVTLDGRALAGATVTFEPEEFLGAAFKPCSGTTDAQGQVAMQGQDAKYPGIYLGLYRVKISRIVSGQETIPARYNSQTELGYEAATDLPNVQGVIEFRLKSK